MKNLKLTSLILGIFALSIMSGIGEDESPNSKVIEKRREAVEQLKQVVPMGSTFEAARKTLAEKFPDSLLVWKGNGIVLSQSDMEERGFSEAVGSKSMRVTIEKKVHGNLPIVEYRFAYFGFDEDSK